MPRSANRCKLADWDLGHWEFFCHWALVIRIPFNAAWQMSNALFPKQTRTTFSIELFCSRNFLISVTAMRAARSNGKPYAPVLIEGKAIERTRFCSAKASELR